MSDTEKYAMYLNSREWAVKRNAVRARCAGICERCHRNPMDHCHHLTYIRKYDERLEDLQGICEPCHTFTHGRSDYDPAKPPAISLNGRTIKSVYMAGTCAPGVLETSPDGEIKNWRSGITGAYFIGHKQAIPPHVDDAVEVGNSKLRYAGPFIYYQHNACIEGAHGDDGSNEVLERSKAGILAADMMFAWIDREDCYGTLAEIGYAAGLAEGPEIAIAGPKRFGELWFVYDMADQINLDAADAKSAFLASFKDDRGGGSGLVQRQGAA